MDEAPSTPNFRIELVPFDAGAISVWGQADSRHRNWPVVYTINNDREIYVGETTSATSRMQQHLTAPARQGLRHVKIVIDGSFNKSACLDLESQLIRYFAADGKYRPQNLCHGMVDSEYFDRAQYQERFNAIFNELVREGVFSRSIPEIVNSDIFKFSPFKALNPEQEVAIDGVLEKLADDIHNESGEPMVVRGDPGTGKTIVAVYLMKLLTDIANSTPDDVLDIDSRFVDFFQLGFRETFTGLRVGLVIPQQSLRRTIEKVFARTPGLHKTMVMGPFQVGKSLEKFDLLIVDETHRLGQRSNQPSAALNRQFKEINIALFGEDRDSISQLDWIKAQSKHQLFLVDGEQTVRPADLPAAETRKLIASAERAGSYFRLVSQMRVAGGEDYIDYVGRVLDGERVTPRDFNGYEIRLCDDVSEMRDAIVQKDREFGLARMIAGYAWEWKSKRNPTTPDIVIDGVEMFWNRTATDWVNSATALAEVGSIHTVQGYDLNYAGVIIGNDLQFDAADQKIIFSRENYFDQRGKENLPRLGQVFGDDEILQYVKNIYRVLMTRGIKGTFVYVCNPELREYLRPFFGN
jgi:uncharacterized protein